MDITGQIPQNSIVCVCARACVCRKMLATDIICIPNAVNICIVSRGIYHGYRARTVLDTYLKPVNALTKAQIIHSSV